jgi:uncharacterized membrane protein YagU involved in acid resistance
MNKIVAGLFGIAMQSGMMVPVATLILHVMFGAVLGLVYSKLGAQSNQHSALNMGWGIQASPRPNL